MHVDKVFFWGGRGVHLFSLEHCGLRLTCIPVLPESWFSGKLPSFHFKETHFGDTSILHSTMIVGDRVKEKMKHKMPKVLHHVFKISHQQKTMRKFTVWSSLSKPSSSLFLIDPLIPQMEVMERSWIKKQQMYV